MHNEWGVWTDAIPDGLPFTKRGCNLQAAEPRQQL